MTKICVSSDWHADARSHGVDRFDDVAQAVAQTVKAAKQEDVDQSSCHVKTDDLSRLCRVI